MNKKFINIKGLSMAYVDEGTGDPIVFLHGNPSSSYEWRNVIPHLVDLGHCIAPDLIGMGDSEKIPNSGPSSYRFIEHREYLDELFSALGIHKNVTLVLHDWGSALGFDWAHRHPHAVKQIAYMEGFVAPINAWDELPPEAVKFFEMMYSKAGEALVLNENFIIEKELPGCMLRKLTEEEMNTYRKPYLEPGESRRPTLTWRREVPVAGKPSDVHEIIQAYGKWLASTKIPKLFIEAIPGVMFESHRKIAQSWPNQQHVKIKGGHFVQEDSPHEVGKAIASWMKTICERE
ncbi:MAG: haloalkane dehalogenase [Legionella sp.]|nr:haloalkane dehalogenase [Legionella sp.]